MITRIYFTAGALATCVLFAGCDYAATERVHPSLQYELYSVSTTQGPTTKAMLDRNINQSVFVQVPPVFTHVDIAALEVTKCDHDQSRVVVVPTAAGLARLKTAAAGGKIGVALNGGDLQRQFRFQPDSSGRFPLSGHPAGRFSDSSLPRVIAP